MLIRNVKSYADLQKKKDFQANLLKVAIDNEAMLESRVKDYQNPNKPPPVPPQYKTNSEIAADTDIQQKEVINNLLSISGVENFLALSVSQNLAQLPNGVGNFLLFNKNFPVIKKRLEDVSKSSYDVPTFMEKIEQVFEQIDLGILYNLTGGPTASSSFNQGIGAGMNIPSGEDVANLIASGQSASDYGDLLLEMYEIRDMPNSTLLNDSNFSATIDMVEKLCNASPNPYLLADIDLLEQFERQKIQKEIDRLLDNAFVPSTAVIQNIIGALIPADFAAAIAQAQNQQQIVLPDAFLRAFSKLQKAIKGIKSPPKTLKDLEILKDKLLRLLGGQVAIQQQLRGQLGQAQQQVMQQQQQAQAAQLLLQQQQAAAAAAQAAAAAAIRTNMVVSQKQTMRALSGNDLQIRERLISQNQHPILPNTQGPALGYYNYLPYAPSLNLGDFRPNLADILAQTPAGDMLRREIIVEVRAFRSKGKAQGGIATSSIFNGNGVQLANPDGGVFTSKAELEAWLAANGRPSLDKYLWKNYINDKNVLYLGCQETLNRSGALASSILRYSPQEMRNIVRQETDALDRLLDTDPNYDPAAIDAQRLVSSQGFGVKRGKGYTIHDFGNDIKGFFGGKVKKDSEMKGGMICPMNYSPTRAKDGKVYNNKCAASAGGGEDPNFKGNPYAVDGMGFMSRKIKIGKGIAIEEQPRYKTFGKYIIHMPFLENENVLNLKFPSMGSIPTLKPVNIDDNFKDFIIDILDSGKVNQKHYDKLTYSEKAHFNKIVKGAGLSNALKFKADDNIDDKKDLKRIDILVGEIIAGNDNDKVKKEAITLIKQCVSNGSMPKYKGMDLLLQIQ